MNMEQNELFIRRVAKMRQRQKEYFKTRSISVLRESMELERLVDAMLTQLLSTIDTDPIQTEMFNFQLLKADKNWFYFLNCQLLR